MIIEPVRKFYLEQKNLKARRSSDSKFRTPGNFEKATQIGILFHLGESEDYLPLASFIKWLETENKKLRILTYFEYHRSTPFQFYFDQFGKEHINQWGKITAPRVIQFVEFPFDFLYCIYTQPQPVFDTLLYHCQAKCRIGPHDPERINLFEVMVKPVGPHHIGSIVEQMRQLSEVLKNNEITY